MKKAFLLILVSMILLLAFTSCDAIKGIVGGDTPELPEEEVCEHVWAEATCRAAKTCTLCGEREGKTLPHTLVEATCEEPKHCTVCNQVYGEPLGHNMSLSSCTMPSTCRRCGLTDGEAPGHDWADPTCTTPKICKTCKNTEGESLGHDYAVVVVEATCETAGYTTHTCNTCGDNYVTDEVAAFGHLNDVVLEAVAPTCTKTGLTAGIACSSCGVATTKQRTVAALGHVYEVTSTVEPTCTTAGYTAYHCTVCGEDYKGAQIPALGHSYGSASCNEAAVCSVCGFDNDGAPIGHDWADATCTAPKMCKREGCGETDGEALGHLMSEGNCIAASTCERCGLTEGEKQTHVLSSTYANGVKTYFCVNCNTSYKLDSAYVLDGSGFDGMTGVNNTLNGYTTSEDKPQYPLITEDGYYQLLQLEDTGAAKQLQIWVPRDNTSRDNFSSGNGAVGFYSFKINAYMDTNFSMQFVDGSAAGSRWSADWCITEKPFLLTPPTDNGEGRMIVTATGWDGLILYEKDVTDTEDKFTGWFEVMMGIVLDVETDTITLYYYVDGRYIGYAVRTLTTSTNAINCVYLSGNTQAKGSGLLIDDIAFGYTIAGAWVFDTHMHTWTAGNTTAPTCVADGYTTYSCACGASCRLDLVTAPGHKSDVTVDGFAPTCTEEGLTDGVKCSVCSQMTKEQKVIAPLGHTEAEVPATAPTCTEAGHSSGVICTVCDEFITETTVVPALGHSYVSSGTEATCTESGFMTYVCSVCEHSYEETLAPKGHDYGSAKCTDSATCLVCNTPSVGAIGHDYAPATCTEPATCKRDCGATTGEALGHAMADATCKAPSTCERCGLTEGEKALHVLESKYVKKVLTYYCAVCDKSYSIDTGYYLDGTSNDGWTGNNNNVANYGSKNPALVDGHYELLNVRGNRGQMQIWLPSESKEQIGFSAANNALGYLSFKLNAYISSDSVDFKLVDSISNQGDNRWQAGGVAATALLIKPVENGYTKLVADDGTVVADIAVGADNFTGWVDVKIAIEMNGQFDQLTLHYYINGQHVYSMSKTLTTITNSINSVYLSGYTTAKGSGIMLDDVAFGYTAGGVFEFDTCKHTFVEATCSTNRYCSVCGYVESGSLGHRGGEATCDTLAVCSDCGQSYGDYAHKMSEATCYQAAVCSDCGKTVGELKPHNVVLKPETNRLKYECSMCGAYYYVETAYYYLDGTDYKNMLPGGFIAQSYANTDGMPVIVEKNGNKYYELINISGVNDSNNSNKAEVWVPAGHPNAEAGYFTGFSAENNATGFLSFKVDANMDLPAQPFKIQLLDHNARNLTTNFWVDGALPEVFVLNTPVDDGNGGKTVTLVGWNNRTLETVKVNETGFTGWIDVKIALVMNSGGTVTAHYYINGEYKGSETIVNRIITGEITAAYFFGYTYGLGCGFRLDDMVLGYTAGGEMVPGITPDTPVEPDEPDEPTPPSEDTDTTFVYNEVAESGVKNANLKTIVRNKIKQWDQCEAHNNHNGTPRYVVAQRGDGTTSEGLYFSKTTPWVGDEGEQFSEFRFAVNSEQPGAYVTKITFNYIIKGSVEKNDRYEFTDLEGNKFSADAYVQVKTPQNHPLAGDNYPELSGTDLICDGVWHTMTIDFGPDGLEIIDILLNLYHFQGEFIIADLNIEYRV